jgi:hypothetical protein
VFHRAHAEVELAIRDLKHGLGLNHLPSGQFGANQAWLLLQTIAHNLGRWAARLGGLAATARQTVKTLRRRYLAVPARLTHHARRVRLRLPTGWPWTQNLIIALTGYGPCPIQRPDPTTCPYDRSLGPHQGTAMPSHANKINHTRP